LLQPADLSAERRHALLARFAICAVVDGDELCRLDGPMAELHPALALLLSTSGSTGSAKQVRLSAANLDANAAAIAEYLQVDESERALANLPFHYAYGLSVLNSHLWAGASLVLTCHGLVSPALWAALAHQQVTSMAGVPFVYETLYRLRQPAALPALRTLTQAGGRLAPELVRHFAQRCGDSGRRFIVMYGQTEATARMAWLPADEVASHPESIGYAIPGGRFELRRGDGSVIDGPDEAGELIYFGPNVMMGYAETASDFASPPMAPVLATGDVATRDGDGRYRICGRLKRFIKIFGERISLDEVERYAESQGWQLAAHGTDGELRLAVARGEVATVTKALAAWLAVPPKVIRAKALAVLPRTASGKIDYPALEACHG